MITFKKSAVPTAAHTVPSEGASASESFALALFQGAGGYLVRPLPPQTAGLQLCGLSLDQSPSSAGFQNRLLVMSSQSLCLSDFLLFTF